MAYKLKHVRILVVNENQALRDLLRDVLLDLGFGLVDTAADTEIAWDLYCDYAPDIILVDWRTDNDDEMDFIRQVRTHPISPTPHVPIIVITGNTNKERVVYARDMGITEFLTKPFNVQALVKYLVHIIEKPRDFVITWRFTGPDRRRRFEDIDETQLKRKKDKRTKLPKTLLGQNLVEKE